MCGRGQPSDDADRIALDLRLDLRGRLTLDHLDPHLEGKAHEGDASDEGRAVAVVARLRQLAHAVDAGGEEDRIAQSLKYQRARGRDADLAFHLHAQTRSTWSPHVCRQ